ncbi:MAG: hypothetical protein AB1482_14480 [Pseudomonadota bacterium]
MAQAIREFESHRFRQFIRFQHVGTARTLKPDRPKAVWHHRFRQISLAVCHAPRSP